MGYLESRWGAESWGCKPRGVFVRRRRRASTCGRGAGL